MTGGSIVVFGEKEKIAYELDAFFGRRPGLH
jgi:hypothetical protein